MVLNAYTMKRYRVWHEIQIRSGVGRRPTLELLAVLIAGSWHMMGVGKKKPWEKTRDVIRVKVFVLVVMLLARENGGQRSGETGRKSETGGIASLWSRECLAELSWERRVNRYLAGFESFTDKLCSSVIEMNIKECFTELFRSCYQESSVNYKRVSHPTKTQKTRLYYIDAEDSGSQHSHTRVNCRE